MLKGKIAYLSPLLDEDCDLLYSWINDRELVLQSSPYRPIHWSNHIDWFRAIRNQANVVIFGIRRIIDDSLAGTCQLHSINVIHRSAELQIRIGRKDAQGCGIGSEACRLLLQHAFLDLNLNRICLHVLENNVRAIHVYNCAGFKLEGTLRRSAYIDGNWVNVLVMAILRDEYTAT